MDVAIGQRLKELRKQAGLTQAQLGELVGFHPQYISRIERGQQHPSWRFLAACANAIQCSLTELLRLAGYVEEATVADDFCYDLAQNPEFLALFDLFVHDPALVKDVLAYARHRLAHPVVSDSGALTTEAAAARSTDESSLLLTFMQMTADDPELLLLVLLWQKIPEELPLLVYLGQQLISAKAEPPA